MYNIPFTTLPNFLTIITDLNTNSSLKYKNTLEFSKSAKLIEHFHPRLSALHFCKG